MRFLLVLALAACTTSAAETSQRTFSDAAYAAHVKALRARLAKLGLGHLDIRIEEVAGSRLDHRLVVPLRPDGDRR